LPFFFSFRRKKRKREELGLSFVSETESCAWYLSSVLEEKQHRESKALEDDDDAREEK